MQSGYTSAYRMLSSVSEKGGHKCSLSKFTWKTRVASNWKKIKEDRDGLKSHHLPSQAALRR